MKQSAVYVNWGRLVADCFCGDARELKLGQKRMTCCTNERCPGHTTELVWPDDMSEILDVLAERDEKDRTWFPADHPFALAGGYPHGQTAAQMRAYEEKTKMQVVRDKRAALIAELRALVTDEEVISDASRTDAG